MNVTRRAFMRGVLGLAMVAPLCNFRRVLDEPRRRPLPEYVSPCKGPLVLRRNGDDFRLEESRSYEDWGKPDEGRSIPVIDKRGARERAAAMKVNHRDWYLPEVTEYSSV